MNAGDKVKVFYCNDYFFGIICGINGVNARVYIPELEEKTEVKAYELELLKDVKLRKKAFRRLCRLEKGIPDYVGEDGYAECIVNSDGYVMTASDLLAAVDVMIERDFNSSDLFLEWYWYFGKMLEEDYEDDEVYSEINLITRVLGEFDDWVEYDEKPDLERIREQIVEFIEDEDKPATKRRYPDDLKEKFLRRYSGDILERTLEENVALYRIFAEDLSKKGNKEGLLALGYGCYGGNRAFECNWETSRDCMLKLVDTVTDMPDRAFYANTLGYIYYYGRCNGGVPQYEEAYKYFSFAAFNGVYEAQYKIADMHKNGYGVIKCEETYKRIIRDLYKENLKYVVEGEFDCKFADIALRMGETFRDDKMLRDDYLSMLCCYMQADFAIRMKMNVSDYYGSKMVFDAIQDALTRVKDEICYRPLKKIRLDSLEHVFAPTFMTGGKLKVSVRPLKNNRYKLTFKESQDKKLFITVPELDMCGLYEKLEATATTDFDIGQDAEKDIVVDSIFNSKFMLEGETVLELPWAEFEVKAVSDDKVYRIATAMIFDDDFDGASDDFLCDGSIRVGDMARITIMGAKRLIKVIRISELKKSQLKYPVKRYKTITDDTKVIIKY